MSNVQVGERVRFWQPKTGMTPQTGKVCRLYTEGIPYAEIEPDTEPHTHVYLCQKAVWGYEKIEGGSMKTEQEVKKEICEAVWHGRINQSYTSEIAARFACSTPVAFHILINIVNGESGDERFKLDKEKGGVAVAGGPTFTHSRQDVGHSREYVWFLT